jgi:hypothetical protein
LAKLCLEYHPFFRTGGESVIIECYELAKFYGTDPDVFLHKPISKIALAKKRSMQLIKLIKKATKE